MMIEEIIKELYGKIRMVPFNGKVPLVPDFKEYLEGNKEYPLDLLLDAYRQGKYIAVILGKQPNGKHLIAFDIENQVKKNGNGNGNNGNNNGNGSNSNGFHAIRIESAVLEVLAYHKVDANTWIGTSINEGYHYYYYLENGLGINVDKLIDGKDKDKDTDNDYNDYNDYNNYNEDNNNININANINANAKTITIKSISFNTIGIEVFTGNRALVTFGQNLENNNIYNIKTISIKQLNSIKETLSLLNRIVTEIKPFYTQGNRDKIQLGIAGILYKHGYDEKFAILVASFIMKLFNDREDRINQCVRQTYKKDKDEVAGYEILKEVNEEMANRIKEFLDKDKDKNGNGKKGKGKDKDKGKEDKDKDKDKIGLFALTAEYQSAKFDNELLYSRFILKKYQEGYEPAKFLDDFRYVLPNTNKEGYWIRWNGYCWQECHEEILKKEMVGFYFGLLDKASDTEKELIMDAISNSKRDAILENLKVDPLFHELGFVITEDDLNNIVKLKLKPLDTSSSSDTIYINCRNCLLIWNDARKDFDVIRHDSGLTKKYYLMDGYDINYNPLVDKPVKFIEFMYRITDKDEDLIRFIYYILGLSSIPRVEEIAVFFIGPGHNGKTTLLEVILGIFGKMAIKSDIALLTEDEDVNPHLVACKGKRLVIIEEPNLIRFKSDTLKKVVSTGYVTARTLYSKPEPIPRRFNVIVATNHMPVFKDDTLGMLRRILAVPFKVVIPKEEAIPSYHRVLLKEKEGIFLLLVTALKDYLAKGIRIANPDHWPSAVKLATDKVLFNNDMIYEYLRRYCIISYDEKDKVAVAELYDNKFLEFARLKGIPKEHIPSKRSFADALERKGIYSVKINKVTYKVGIRLRTVADIADLIDDDLKDEPIANANTNINININTNTNINTNDNNNDNKGSSPSSPSNPSLTSDIPNPSNPSLTSNPSVTSVPSDTSNTSSPSSPTNPASTNNPSSPTNSSPADQPDPSLKFKVIEFDELMRPFRYAKFVTNGNTVVMVRSYDDLKTLECLHCNNYFTYSMELFRHIHDTFKVKITDMDIIQCNEDGSAVKEGIWIPEFKFSIGSGFNQGSNGIMDDQRCLL